MELVMVEREVAPGTPLDDLSALEEAVAWCLEQHRVRFQRTYVSLDGTRMVCVYAAPDAESVRQTQRTGGLPFTRIWSAHVIGPATAAFAAEPGWSTVVVERELDRPHTVEDVEAARAATGGCLATYRVVNLVSLLARDGLRMLCICQAPDAEAVRVGNRKVEMPLDRAWTASVHEASAPDR